MLKQVEPPMENPEALLRSLDLEMLASRSKRETAQKKRVAVLVCGLLLVVSGTTVALLALFSSISGLPHGGVAQQPPTEVVQTP